MKSVRLSDRRRAAEQAIDRLPYSCRRCGEEVSTPTHRPVLEQMCGLQVCFRCWFWLECVKIRDEPYAIRLDGTHYAIGPAGYRFGFYGRTAEVVFRDGRVVGTRSLWWQGRIPDHFREELPDNAEEIIWI